MFAPLVEISYTKCFNSLDFVDGSSSSVFLLHSSAEKKERGKKKKQGRGCGAERSGCLGESGDVRVAEKLLSPLWPVPLAAPKQFWVL